MLFLFLSCTSSQNTPIQVDAEHIQDLAIYPSERIPSVLVVAFESAEPGDSHIVFGHEGEMQYTTPIQRNQSSHRAYLVGMNPSSDVELKIILETEEERYESPIMTAQSGSLAFERYAFEVTINNYPAPPETTSDHLQRTERWPTSRARRRTEVIAAATGRSGWSPRWPQC